MVPPGWRLKARLDEGRRLGYLLRGASEVTGQAPMTRTDLLRRYAKSYQHLLSYQPY